MRTPSAPTDFEPHNYAILISDFMRNPLNIASFEMQRRILRARYSLTFSMRARHFHEN